MNDRVRAWAHRLDLGLLSAARARFLLGALGVLLLGGVAVLILGRSGRAMDPITVRLAGPVDAPGSPATRVRVAVTPASSPHDGLDHYEQLGAYLGRRLRRPVAIVARRTFGEIDDLLAAGKVQAAVLCTGAYLEARGHHIAIDAIAVPSHVGATSTEAVIVVAAASPIQTFADLRQRSFAFTDPLAIGGHGYPLVAVRRAGSDPSSFFSRTVFTYGDEASIRAVRDGEVDGAAVDRRAFDLVLATHGSWRHGLRVIDRSARYGAGPVVVPASLAPDLRRALEEAWLGMHESSEGREVLRGLRITRFEVPGPDLYDSASRLVAEASGHGDGGFD